MEKLWKKLRLTDNLRCLIVNAPNEYSSLLADFTYETTPSDAAKGNYDFVQIFAKTQAELEKTIVEVGEQGKYDCLFWACYPKMTGSIKSDLKRETVWQALHLIGCEPVSQIAIDDTWSALRARPAQATKRQTKV